MIVTYYILTGPDLNASSEHDECQMIRHDTMKEILGMLINNDDRLDSSNTVSTIQPSRVDGFLNGVSILLHGRGGYYQVWICIDINILGYY